MTEQELHELGFSKYELFDEIEKQDTGNYGYALEINFYQLNRCISIYILNNKQDEPTISDIREGDIIENIKIDELSDYVSKYKAAENKIQQIIKETL